MELMEAIMRRRSIRKFTDEEVSDKDIGEMLMACKWAPSAGNKQPWEVIVVRDEEIKEELVDAAMGQKWIKYASAVLVVCINKKIAKGAYGDRGVELYAVQSTAAAIQNMLLRATELDLGTCWVGAFDEGSVAGLLGCEDWIRPVALIPVGHPKRKPTPPDRYDIADFTYENQFGEDYKGKFEGITKKWRKLRRKLKDIAAKRKETKNEDQ